ncbi:AAA family ATPase [Cylindrospermopsis raciborskii DSH]|uniref:AAA family ATPase n=1 Tax=Cylindrospermopsis raciborskii TaxID=77022 RepID=UPI002EDAB901
MLRNERGPKNLYSSPQGTGCQHPVHLHDQSPNSLKPAFQWLNQLTDITISRDFSTICGYTQEDLEQTFAQHLQGRLG